MRFGLRYLAARAANKLIRHLPNSRLLFYVQHWIHLNLEDCEPELKNIGKLLPHPSQRRIAIDIGANLGFYSMTLKNYFYKVYAFEVNPYLANQLTNVSPRISVFGSGLSSQKGLATLYVPTIGNTVLTGWASLHEGNCPDADGHHELSVQTETLDSYGFTHVDFIKIDVEGHEDKVLLGARNTLIGSSPVLLIEIKDHNVIWVTNYLKLLGYEQVHYPFQAQRMNNENYVFAKLI
jgi:FkbM family methyltransferase